MNEFLSQFLVECREIVDQASERLLELEKSPRDAQILDAVFRDFHTLKGSAGIVDFAAMEHAVHAAEDILSSVRTGAQPLTPERVGECLACLDQVTAWLDIIERTGELPVIGATAAHPERSWLPALLARHPDLQAAAAAVRFVPLADCFFEGEDPLARLAALPGLLALEVEPAEPWPDLGDFDPYRCNLVLMGITAAAPAAASAHLHGCVGECSVLPVAVQQSASAAKLLSANARAVLQAQLEMLDATKPLGFRGRVESAGRAAAAVLRSEGQPDGADDLLRTTHGSVAERSSQPLREAIARLLVMAPESAAHTAEAAPRIDAANRTLRVDASRIDALVRLTSELTVAKNSLGHLARLGQSQSESLPGLLKQQHASLERLVSEMQASVLQLRVVPLRSVFQRFPRLVREMAQQLGKLVQLEVEGEDTEADKAVVETLFEPLLHLIRNAMDHGVETAAERTRRGKAPTATVRVRASRQADRVLIEISDDGSGVNVGRVREVALKRGVVSEERLQAMSEAQIIDLIFAPGFSTAATVTEHSGRGVGMDAVRTAVERLGGSVRIDSVAAEGTRISVSLPFSVMLTRILTVEAGGQSFGIPLDNITETLRVPRDSISGIGAGRAMVVRDRTLPIVSLSAELGISPHDREKTEVTIVIISAAGMSGGLQVDRIGEQMEVILQPMDGLLAGTPGVSGTTLLGDGQVLLVLDVGAVLQ